MSDINGPITYNEWYKSWGGDITEMQEFDNAAKLLLRKRTLRWFGWGCK